jgi:hypothetical protein
LRALYRAMWPSGPAYRAPCATRPTPSATHSVSARGYRAERAQRRRVAMRTWIWSAVAWGSGGPSQAWRS